MPKPDDKPEPQEYTQPGSDSTANATEEVTVETPQSPFTPAKTGNTPAHATQPGTENDPPHGLNKPKEN